MSKNSGAVHFLYTTVVGRALLKGIQKLHLDRCAVGFLRSSLSKSVIGWYAKQNRIVLNEEQKCSFGSYRDFFVRLREDRPVDTIPEHLISPCDGYLSAFTIDEKSCFAIKNSHYRVQDFLQSEKLATHYQGGDCLIFRLCASDYHHYSYIDNGYQGKHHFIPGVLHSVQPIACEQFPVYILNKRCWSLLKTENFGPVVQTEIGALIVGGICNHKQNEYVAKGTEKGHFDLAGSTIVLLFEKGKIALKPEILSALKCNEEVRVVQGQWIGNQIKN